MCLHVGCDLENGQIDSEGVPMVNYSMNRLVRELEEAYKLPREHFNYLLEPETVWVLCYQYHTSEMADVEIIIHSFQI